MAARASGWSVRMLRACASVENPARIGGGSTGSGGSSSSPRMIPLSHGPTLRSSWRSSTVSASTGQVSAARAARRRALDLRRSFSSSDARASSSERSPFFTSSNCRRDWLALPRAATRSLPSALATGGRFLRAGCRLPTRGLLGRLACTAARRLRLGLALLPPLLHHGARRNFLCSAAVTPGLLGALLDLFVLTLLFLGRTDWHTIHLLLYEVPGTRRANPRCYLGR